VIALSSFSDFFLLLNVCGGGGGGGGVSWAKGLTYSIENKVASVQTCLRGCVDGDLKDIFYFVLLYIYLCVKKIISFLVVFFPQKKRRQELFLFSSQCCQLVVFLGLNLGGDDPLLLICIKKRYIYHLQFLFAKLCSFPFE